MSFSLITLDSIVFSVPSTSCHLARPLHTSPYDLKLKLSDSRGPFLTLFHTLDCVWQTLHSHLLVSAESVKLHLARIMSLHCLSSA